MVNNPREGLKTLGVVLKHSISKKLHIEPDSEDESNDDESNHDECTPESVAPLSKYRYEGLPGSTSIRLLRLQPGKGQDPIRCNVIVADVKTCSGQYEALSYVWGAPEGHLRIQIDDAGLEIQPNLHCALVDLRSPEKSRCLWIDAICIDQSNELEREKQVPLMCEIYCSASRTICYLGPEMKKTTRKAYAMLQELAVEAKMHRANDATTVPSFINHVPINPVQSSLREKYVGDYNIMHVASCGWWFRAWTVQESLLCDNAVVVIGRRSMEWREFCAAIDHGFNIQIWSPVHFGFIKDGIIVPYLSLRALVNRRRRRQQLISPAHELLNLLIHCRHRASKDPRDKIYALLGLLRDSHFHAMDAIHPETLCIKPDYLLPVIDVYRQVSQELIEKMDNLDVMGVTPKSTRPGLPSWVTDWSVTDNISSPLTQDSLDRNRLTHASKGMRGSFQFPKDGKTIVLNGCELTSVQNLADSLRYMKITTALVPINATRLEPELIQPASLGKDPVESINQGDTNTTMTTLEQLVAAAKKLYNPPEKHSLGALRAWGRIQETLHHFSDRFHPDAFEDSLNLEDFANTFRTLFAWEKFSRAHGPASSRGRDPTKQADNPSDLYWQTLCAGTYQDGDVERTKALFDEWSQSLQLIRSLFEKYPQAVEKMPSLVLVSYWKTFWEGYSPFWPYIACAIGRRLGRAANGWLCLLPGDAEVGDRIILARGGRVPLVIRPLVGVDGCFSFVGEAYIHGIMDGEAFVEEECEDIRIC